MNNLFLEMLKHLNSSEKDEIKARCYSFLKVSVPSQQEFPVSENHQGEKKA